MVKKSIAYQAYDDALKYLLVLKDFEKKDQRDIFYKLARLYKQTDQHDKAIEILERIIEKNNKDIEAYSKLADINNFKLANYDKSLQYFL